MQRSGGELSLEEASTRAEAMVVQLGEQRYGIAAGHISRVVQMVEVAPLPGAPDVVAGVIDVGGEIVPVVDPRVRLGHPRRAGRAGDQLVIAHTDTRLVAVWVDRTVDFVRLQARDVEPVDQVLSGGPPVAGVSRTPDGLLVITDLDAFLSLEDEMQLQSALGARAAL